MVADHNPRRTIVYKADSDAFKRLITEVYLKAPCAVQPTALWKTMRMLESMRAAVKFEGRRPRAITACGGNTLLVYWADTPGAYCMLEPPGEGYSVMLMNQRALSTFNPRARQAYRDEVYFKLVHTMKSLVKPRLPNGFIFKNAQCVEEAGEIARFITGCYANIRVTPEQVRAWTGGPAHFADLWVWVFDARGGLPAAFGLAQLDRRIGEGELDWIQVSPQYRHMGLGSALVRELIFRMRGRARFITVSGGANNPTNPERLYRACGFEGGETWHILQKG